MEQNIADQVLHRGHTEDYATVVRVGGIDQDGSSVSEGCRSP